ncbi:IclR family transcriptional regulator domain-containing protein [Nocardia sp. R7R-8]|uniref:IclR family transcriptional regulator domain-containing protein n=1 Tax=Nocardia sp. R7R-8 TaxID=3459304 RepID=UPI00403D6D7B
MEIAQTADHALRILLSLSEDGPQSIGELATRLDLARTVTRRLVVTLQRRSFVKVDGGRVSIGPSVLAIAAKAVPDVYREAQPLLDELARDIGETIVVSVLDGNEALVVASAKSDIHPLRVEYPLGYRHRAATGAAGRAILFNLAADRAEEMIAAESDDPVALERFREERGLGYAVSHDELRLGAYGIAVPLRIAQQEASLSIVAPAGRGHELLRHLGKLQDTAAELGAI